MPADRLRFDIQPFQYLSNKHVLEHAYLRDIGRVEYQSATDQQALKSFHDLTKTEGIMPALETSHALAYVNKIAPKLSKSKTIVINLSGRGDKDMFTVAKEDGMTL